MLAGACAKTIQPGTMISNYRVLNVLGEGGMGVVYDVVNEQTGRPRALKMLHPEFARGEIITRFKRETMLGGALTHRNIIELIDSGTHQGAPFLVMEKLDGTDLATHVRERAMPFQEVYPIITQIMDALEYAHSKGVTHRDLKPANIFICKGDPLRVKLLDFGIANLRDDAEVKDTLVTQANMLIGTPDYMSPEQALRLEIDYRTDIFALGAILYRMLSGKKPFHGRTGEETRMNIAAEGIKPKPLEELVSGIPPGTQAVIDRALKKDKGQRFQSIAEFRAMLRRVHDDAQRKPQNTPTMIRHKGAANGTNSENGNTATTITMTPKRQRSLALWFTIGFLAISGGVGIAYYFKEPHVTSLVNRAIREGKKLFKGVEDEPKKEKPPKHRDSMRHKPMKPKRRKHMRKYRRRWR